MACDQGSARVYVGDSTGTVAELNGSGFDILPTDAAGPQPTDDILVLRVSPDGVLFAATPVKLWKYDGAWMRLMPATGGTDVTNPHVSGSSAADMYVLDDQRGLLHYDGNAQGMLAVTSMSDAAFTPGWWQMWAGADNEGTAVFMLAQSTRAIEIRNGVAQESVIPLTTTSYPSAVWASSPSDLFLVHTDSHTGTSFFFVYYFDGEVWSQVRTPALATLSHMDGVPGQAIYFADTSGGQLIELLYPHPISARTGAP